MSIVKMNRLTVVGLQQEQDAVMEMLMRLGALEIEQTEEPADLEAGLSAAHEAHQPLADQRGSVDQLISRFEQAISWLNQQDQEKKPAFSSRRQLTAADLSATADREIPLTERLSFLEKSRAREAKLRSEISRLETKTDLLSPWLDFSLDLSRESTRYVQIFLGSFDTHDQLRDFQAALAEEAPETVVSVVSEQEAALLCAICTWKPREAIVRSHLRRCGFDLMPLQGQAGTARQQYDEANRIKQLYEQELAGIEKDHQAACELLPEFELLLDYLLVRRDKLLAGSHLPVTGRTFWLEGWVPEHLTARVEKKLKDQFVIALEKRPALPGEEHPILFRNNRLVKPYEVIVEMFSPPSSREIDPSPLLAPFYFFFFGMMLSDVGYGLLLTGLCLFLIYKVKATGEMGRISRMLLMSGIASTLWGFVFGGFFGDMLTVLSNGRLVFPAIWFNPMDDATRLMIWSMIFGLLHIFAGMAAKAYMMFQTGRAKDAVLDIFPWYFLLVGLGLMIGNIGGSAGLWLVGASAAVLVLFGGRDARNPIMRLLKGIMSLYNITGYFSDILSYTRILALVLATSVIAMVVNLLGFLLGPTPLGILLFIVVAAGGHVLNLALSALSAYVHTSRLHFVEFFSKFYDGGGRMWNPLRLKTRYVDIVKDEKN